MAANFDKALWFYRGIGFQQQVSEKYNLVFEASRSILAVIGLLVALSVLFSVTRFILSTFILPGKSVSNSR